MRSTISLVLTSLALLAALASAGCAGGSVNVDPTEDGVYLVLRRGALPIDVEPIEGGEAFVVYDYEFLDPADRRPPEYVVVDTTEWIPIALSEPPMAVSNEGAPPSLHMQFSSAAAEQLKDFTSRHVGAPVAIVVGEKVVTLHKVRTAITGGAVVITRCADDACEFIRLKLSGPKSSS